MTFTQAEALCALRALYRTAAYHNEATAYAGKYVAMGGPVPDWLVKMTAETDKWFVRHLEATHCTYAKSREDAINNVRFNLYGRVPLDQLPPFDAVCPAYVIMDAVGAKRRELGESAPRDLFGKKTLSKADALARLRRMAG